MTSYSKIGLSLSLLSGIWIPATLLCCVPWVQKQMLYLHNFTFFPGRWLNEPERAGFLKNQVTPFRIATKDGEQLFAWLIVPLGVYVRHTDEFIQEKSGVDDIEEKLAFKLLQTDPEARLLLYFHGNSATLAQRRRTEEYRSFSAGASDKVFILAFDYRGFGSSSGAPSETGLMNDAEAVVDWALNTAQIPPKRIVLLGHSLGTAVVAGIAHQYHGLGVEFAGLVLCAAFSNAGNAFSSYSIGGIVPVLAPVRLMPSLQAWFSQRMRDTWRSDERLAAIARSSARFYLVLVHADDDTTMPWQETDALFRSTISAAAENTNQEPNTQNKMQDLRIVDLGEAGRQEVWQKNSTYISKTIAKHGGHNTTMTWAPVALSVLQAFGIAAPTTRV